MYTIFLFFLKSECVLALIVIAVTMPFVAELALLGKVMHELIVASLVQPKMYSVSCWLSEHSE